MRVCRHGACLCLSAESIGRGLCVIDAVWIRRCGAVGGGWLPRASCVLDYFFLDRMIGNMDFSLGGAVFKENM